MEKLYVSITRYEDVQNETTEEYFGNNQFSIDAFNKKYRLQDDETYVKALKRVCDFVSSVEATPELQKYWSERWFDEIYNDWWHPAGSIMSGAGSDKKISLGNCTTISLGTYRNEEDWDNLESIIKNTTYTVAKSAAYRQGLGIDFSRLRPNKASLYNSARESTGSTHWMQFIDSLAFFVGQKGRIPALLFSLSCKHPDLLDFIYIKKNRDKIQNANLSIQCTNDFYQAIENNEDWELVFEIPETNIGDKVYIHHNSATENCIIEPDTKRCYYIATKHRPSERIVKKLKARYILEEISKQMLANSEPCIQNIDVARKYSNSDYVYDSSDIYDSKIVSTNACCTIGNTLILTSSGYYPIKDLINKNTTIWNGYEWSDVRPFIAGYNCDIYKITLSNGMSLECTDNHIWKINDNTVVKDVFTSNLKIGDWINYYNLPIVDCKEDFPHAYTHGFFCGDGWTDKKKRRKDTELFGEKQKLVNVLECSKNRNINKKGSIHVSLPSDMCDKFVVPINYSIKSKLEWLAGILDSDGCSITIKTPKRTHQHTFITNTNLNFLLDIQKLLTTLGVFSRVALYRKAGIDMMPCTRNGAKAPYKVKACYRLYIADYQVQKLCQLGLATYRVKLNSYSTKYVNKPIKIKAIEKLDKKETVYCFTEPKNHTGCFNGIVTGQSEQYLSKDSLCILSSINFGKFNTKEELYKQQLDKISESIGRFLDNVNECEIKYHTYATQEQKIAIEKLRRIGAGLTNICEWLLKAGLIYGTKEATTAVSKFVEYYNYCLYRTSIKLGAEKGNFGLFDKEKYTQSPFIKHMMELGLEFNTMRNVTCSSIAPNGTLSLMFRRYPMSYGVEPPFGLYYWKRTRIEGKYTYYFCVPTIVREMFADKGFEIPMSSDTIMDTWDGSKGKSIAKFIEDHKDKVGIKSIKDTDVNVMDKLAFMSELMKNIDSSISTTYMLPSTSTWKDVYNLIIESHKQEVKSIAAFPEKQMYGIISLMPFKDLAVKLLTSQSNIHPMNFSPEELQILHSLNLTPISATEKLSEIERPRSLPCDVYHITALGKKYFVLVGIMNGKPYEVFAGKNNCVPNNVTKGQIIRKRKSYYVAKFEDSDIELSPVTAMCGEMEEIITRLTSLALRGGTDILLVVKQLEKAGETSGLLGFAKSIARALKKYIKDGTVDGDACPSCGNALIRQEGCLTCSCGYSKCG